MTAWGFSLLADFFGCNNSKLRSKEEINEWIKVLVPAIGMKAYGEPILLHFAEHNPLAVGYTAIQPIETSCIVAHFAENIGEMYLDICSCKDFDKNLAVNLTRKYFEATEWEESYIPRGGRGRIYKVVDSVISGLNGEMGRAFA